METSELSNSNSMFVNSNLDSFLDVLSANLALKEVSSRACAVSYHPDSSSSVSREVKPKSASASDAYLLKEFEGPAFISCFDKTIKLSSSQTESKKTKFYQKAQTEPSVVTLSKYRFPTTLKYCYVKNFDFEKDDRTTIKKPPFDQRNRNRRKSRRNKLSLYENELDNDRFPPNRNALPTSDDIQKVYDQVFPGRHIPYVYGCQGDSENSSCALKCSSLTRNFGICMEVRYVEGRPLPPIVLENVAKVQNESGVVDRLAAMIAVSAVKTSEPSKSRLIIPVSYDLLNKIGVYQNQIFECKVKVEDDTDPEVHQVVEDMLKFVDRQSEFKQFDYDPDSTVPDLGMADDLNKSNSSICSSERSESASPYKISSPSKPKKRKKSKIVRELGKLLNVSITDEAAETEEDGIGGCLEPSCALGCVCFSIKEKPIPQDHCGNFECMFECNCTVQYSYVNEGELAKHEKTWHQTVVRKKNNDVEFTGFERSKRQTKAPSKYEDTVTGRLMDQCFRLRRTRDPSTEDPAPRKKRRSHVDEKNSAESTTATAKEEKVEFNIKPERPAKGSVMKRAINEFDRAVSRKRLSAVSNHSAETLDFVYIWCCIHDKYDCYCYNWVIMTRTEALLLKPTRLNRYSAQRCMEKVSLGLNAGPDARQVILFDRVKQCSRTAGCLVNYSARNTSETYRNLIKCQIEYDVLSYSNGFIKAQPVATIMPESITDNHPFVRNYRVNGIGEVVKMAPSCENESVDVGTYDLQDGVFDDSFEELVIDHVTSMSQDLNDEFEYHPKPASKKKTQSFRPCFSLYQSTSRPTKSQSLTTEASSSLATAEEESDSDVEIVEDKWDVVSLSSCSPDEDGDEDWVDDSKMEKPLTPIARSEDGSVTVTEDDKDTTSPKVGEKRPSIEERQPLTLGAPASKKPRSEGTEVGESTGHVPLENPSENPIVIESDDEDVVIVEDDAVRHKERLVQTSSLQAGEISITETKEDVPIECQASPAPSEETDELPELNDLEEDYPSFGLFCMDHPKLGYLPVEVNYADGSILVEDPLCPSSSKAFRDLHEADIFLKGLARKFIDPKVQFSGKSKWSKVTRGVLMKYNSKKIRIVRKLTTLKVDGTGVRLVVSRKLVSSDDGRLVKMLSDPKPPAQLKIAPQVAVAPSVSVQTEDPVESAAQPATSQSPEVVKKVVGTFKNMSEAASYIEKNFSTKVVQAQSQPTVQTTPSTAVPAVTAVARPQGSRLMSVQTESGWRTVLIRGPIPPTLAHRVRPLTVNNVRMSTNSPGFLRVSHNQLISNGAPVRLPASVSTASVVAVKKAALPISTTASTSATLPVTTSTSPVTTLASDPSGKPTFTVRTLQRPILPKILPTMTPIRVKPKVTPRRAEVIVPRNEAFATVISPTPTPDVSTTSTPKMSMPSEAKVLYNGIVVAKSDLPGTPMKAFVSDKNTSPNKLTSLLPQKTPQDAPSL